VTSSIHSFSATEAVRNGGIIATAPLSHGLQSSVELSCTEINIGPGRMVLIGARPVVFVFAR